MSLYELSSNNGKKRKRVGRGNSSGHGNYSTRGSNGQNQRTGGGVRPGFEGGQTGIARRLPKLRGAKNPTRVPFQVVNVDLLEKFFKDGDTVDLVSLTDKGVIKRKDSPVKVLGNGELKKKLTVKLDKVSKSAQEKIEKAGGSVVA